MTLLDVFQGAFVATLAFAAITWLTMVVRLAGLSRPIERGTVRSVRRLMGIEMVWTLVPAAVVIAVTLSVLLSPGW